MTTDEIIAKRVTKYTVDLSRHRAPSQSDGVCRCDDCLERRKILSELRYIQMAARNLGPRAAMIADKQTGAS